MVPSIRTASTSELGEVVRIDDDAAELYAEAGLAIVLPPSHPFSIAEGASWSRAANAGSLFLAVEERDTPLGFAAVAPAEGFCVVDEFTSGPAIRRQLEEQRRVLPLPVPLVAMKPSAPIEGCSIDDPRCALESRHPGFTREPAGESSRSDIDSRVAWSASLDEAW